MMVKDQESTYSRKWASLGMISMNQLHYSNPWLIAAWSFFFPGFGHIMLGEYIQGWILFLWELFVNLHANFNTAIVLAMTGHFRASITELVAGGTYWILIYGVVFSYAIFGSYNLAVEINRNYRLAFEENSPVEIFKINAFQFNFFSKHNPWIAVGWSLLMPGLGDMYSRRLTSSIFTLGWWIAILHFSNFLPAIAYTLTGHFQEVRTVVRPEWLLFLPSIYGFTLYNSYTAVTEQNKIFDKQQANYLKAKYQSPRFPFRVSKESNQMRVISTFEHALQLEEAIVSISGKGISPEQIYAVPLNKNDQTASISLDSMHHSDGKSLIDVPVLVSAFFCALGTIYGFVLQWGPVLWGGIGFVAGLLIGTIIKLFTLRWSAERERKESRAEVVLMIDCDKNRVAVIEEILWKHQALGVAATGFE